MIYKVLCIALLVVTGLLSLVIAYLITNIKAMAKAMNNYTHNKQVVKTTNTLKTKIEELKLKNEELTRKIKYLEDEVEIVIKSRTKYIEAFTDLQDCYGIACGTIFNLFKEGLLIKNITSRWLFDDLVGKGYIEVYNPKRNFDITGQEIEEIFGANIFATE